MHKIVTKTILISKFGQKSKPINICAASFHSEEDLSSGLQDVILLIFHGRMMKHLEIHACR